MITVNYKAICDTQQVFQTFVKALQVKVMIFTQFDQDIYLNYKPASLF